MKYLVKIQFFTPDRIPTATGEWTIEAEDKGKALDKITEQIETFEGYHRKEFEVIDLIPFK